MPTIDLSTALSTARLVLPGAVSDPTAAAALKARVADDWDELDAAARDWSGLGRLWRPRIWRGSFGQWIFRLGG